MLSEREQDLLILLEQEEPRTLASIADTMHVSTRTVRNDINALNQKLENAASLEIQPKVGVILTVSDPDKYKEILQESFQSSMPQTPEERSRFLINALLKQQNWIKTEQLADLLYISESTIARDLKSVRTILEQFDLQLVSRPKYGMKVQGEEVQKRLCAAWVNRSGSKVITDENHFKIERILEETFEKYNFQTSDFAFHNLIMHLQIAMRRLQEEHEVPIPEDILHEIQAKEQYEIACEIAARIEEEFEIELPEEEKAYICMHLLGKQAPASNQGAAIITQRQHQVVCDSLSRLSKEYNLQLDKDLDLQLALTLHMIPLEYRLEYGLNLRNPLLDQIKEEYPYAFLLGVSLARYFEEDLGEKISEDEIGYLALHLQLSLEKDAQSIQKKNILLVCATGQGTARLLEHQFRKLFAPYIETLKVCDAGHVSRMNLDDIDFVFTTVTLPCTLSVPVIETSPFFARDEVKKMQQTLEESCFEAGKYIPRELFFHKKGFEGQQEYFDWITSQVQKLYEIPDDFEMLLKRREELNSTSFVNGVAIPHPAELCTKETFASITVLDKPLTWGQYKADILALVSLEKGTNPDCTKLFQSIARVLTNEKSTARLRSHPEYDIFMEMLTQTEKKD